MKNYNVELVEKQYSMVKVEAKNKKEAKEKAFKRLFDNEDLDWDSGGIECSKVEVAD